MASRTHEIEIAAPPDRVFEALVSVHKHPLWQQGLIRTESDSDRPTTGRRGAEVRRMIGREMRFTYEITEFEPGKAWGFRATSGPIRPQAHIELSASDGGTKMVSRLEMPGPLGGLAIGALLKQQQANYVRLKVLIEAGQLP